LSNAGINCPTAIAIVLISFSEEKILSTSGICHLNLNVTASMWIFTALICILSIKKDVEG
jgi:hypothetical protein